MKYESALCTLNAVIEQVKTDTSTDVSLTSASTTVINALDANTQAYLKRLITGVSGLIEGNQQRTFIPYSEAKTHTRKYIREYLMRDPTEYRLYMKDDLLSISAVTWVTTALTSSQYSLYDGEDFPNGFALFDPDAITEYPDDFGERVTITGTWGYHRDPDNMFKDSGTTVTGAETDSDTTIAVVSAANIEVYSYIKIGSEYLLVTGISGTDLTVERGARGTTAAAMSGSEIVYNYQQTPEVAQAARRLVVVLFQNRAELGDLIVLGDGVYKVNTEQIKLNLRRYSFGVV